MFGISLTYSWQVKDAENRLRHKLFPPIAWMKLTDFNVLTCCPKTCQNRQPILPGNIVLFRTCTVAAIPCCSIFPRNWLNGLQTTMLWSSMCLPDLTRQNPGALRHSIEFCRHASCLTRAESTFTPSRQ